MKVRLSVGKIPWSGYINIDPAPQIEQGKENQYTAYAGDIKDLDLFVEDAQCVELLTEDCLDYISVDIIIDVIKHWIKKLRHGGRIILRGTNLESIVKMFLNGELTTLDLNHIMYGKSNNPLDHKYGCFNLEDIDEICRQEGLIIVSKKLDQFEFILIAQRP